MIMPSLATNNNNENINNRSSQQPFMVHQYFYNYTNDDTSNTTTTSKPRNMSFLSASAPRLYPKDLEREFAGLSESARAEVENDLYGKAVEEGNKNEKEDEAAEQQLPNSSGVVVVDDPKPEQMLRDMEQELCADENAQERFHAMDRSVKLRFLEAERLNVPKAVQRLLRYWKEKDTLFGSSDHHRTSDGSEGNEDNTVVLTDEDFTTLNKGGLRILPSKDEHGRCILYSDRSRWNHDRDSMMRICWHVIHEALESDPQLPSKGLVIVSQTGVTGASLEGNFDRKVNKRILKAFREVFPVKVVAIHMLLPNKSSKGHDADLALPQLLSMLGPFLRLRCRFHHHPTTLDSLEPYGITAKMLPTTTPTRSNSSGSNALMSRSGSNGSLSRLSLVQELDRSMSLRSFGTSSSSSRSLPLSHTRTSGAALIHLPKDDGDDEEVAELSSSSSSLDFSEAHPQRQHHQPNRKSKQSISSSPVPMLHHVVPMSSLREETASSSDGASSDENISTKIQATRSSSTSPAGARAA